MLYWSEVVGASVFINQNKVGHIENLMIDPVNKAVVGFIRTKKYRYKTRFFHAKLKR